MLTIRRIVVADEKAIAVKFEPSMFDFALSGSMYIMSLGIR